jgi:hypothetical protein
MKLEDILVHAKPGQQFKRSSNMEGLALPYILDAHGIIYQITQITEQGPAGSPALISREDILARDWYIVNIVEGEWQVVSNDTDLLVDKT